MDDFRKISEIKPLSSLILGSGCHRQTTYLELFYIVYPIYTLELRPREGFGCTELVHGMDMGEHNKTM